MRGQSLHEFGKIPPQAIDIEEAVLGACMLEKTAIFKASVILTPECFYKNSHQHIFEAITNLFTKSQPIDTLTVWNELKRNGNIDEAGGLIYISELTRKIASAANVEHHARIIKQCHVARQLITIGSEITRDAYDDTIDVFKTHDKALTDLLALGNSLSTKNVQTLMEIAHDVSVKTLTLADSTNEMTGVSSGLSELDKATGGFQTPDLVIVAARPGMGKTAFMLKCAKGASEKKKRTLVFSLEMSKEQLATRLICDMLNIDSERMRSPRFLNAYEKDTLARGLDALDLPIHIDDTPAVTLNYIRAKAIELKLKYEKSEEPLSEIIVDYLQLMTGTGGSREQEISSISRGLKGLCKELGLPIIALSQLSRAVETRGGDKRPQLSDLRESGAIEQDADMVIFLYRPEYYGVENYENGDSTKGVCEIIIAKHRNGGLETVNARFEGAYSRFSNLKELAEQTQYGKIHRPSEDDFDKF